MDVQHLIPVIEGMMASVRKNIDDLLKREHELPLGVGRDVRLLQSEFEKMCKEFASWSAYQRGDQANHRAREVRDLVDKIDNCISLVAVTNASDPDHVPERSSLLGLFDKARARIRTLGGRHNSELQDLRARVFQVNREHTWWFQSGFFERKGEDAVDEQMYLVGIDGPRGEVIGMMDLGSAGVKVVSIVGVAGAGKTTLGVEVYRRLGEQQHFQCGAIVSVGQRPDTRKVLKDILYQVEGRSANEEMADVDQLTRKLKEHLQDKRLEKIKVLKDILHRLERQSLHNKIVLENILYHQGCSGNGSGRERERESEGEGDEMADVDVDQLIKKLTEHLQDMRLNKKAALNDILYRLERCSGSGSGSESEGKGDKMADADVDQLTRKLTEHLQDKRYFIIIDDLWSTEAWRTMKCYFPENNLGSRIMTLTRNETVAKFCSGPINRVYKIHLLNDVDSKTLFFKGVFPAADVCPPDLMDVSTQIMRKCGGLPLAIVTIANRLASKPITGEVWEKFGLDWKPTKLDWRPIELDWPVDWRPLPHLYSMTKTLNLSYKDLPQHLKICFLYLSIFPEDYKIDKERLLRRWIAEGFIGEEGDLSKDETANSYFNELISRNMIQPLDVDFNGQARSCTLHPVMFDFVASESTSAEFVTVLHTQQQDVKHKNVRHLSLHCDNKNSSAAVQSDTMNFSQARSFTLIGHANGMPPLTMSKVIRVLDLEDSKGPVEQCLKGLCNLLLLKYLSLKGTDVSELPEHIGDLQSLETLDVRSTKVQELPPDIVKLEKLVHLLAGFVKLPVEIGNMRALQTLSCIDVGKNSITALQELGELNNLRDLAMFCDATGTSSDQLDSVLSSLAKLFALRCLTVVGRGGSSVDFLASLSPPPSLLERFRLEESKLRRIPGWMAQCSNLIEVDISIEEIGEDGLTILQGLPRLLRLCLSLLFIPQEPVTFRVDRFQSLKQLIFQCSFPSLIFESGTLLKLEGLELRFEKGLAEESIGVSGIECLPSLKHVFIEFSHWDAGATATVAAVRNAAAMIQPKHPAVTVKGKRRATNVAPSCGVSLNPRNWRTDI